MGAKEHMRIDWECQGRLLSVPVCPEQSSSPHNTATTPVHQDFLAWTLSAGWMERRSEGLNINMTVRCSHL